MTSGKKFTFPKYVLYTLQVDAAEWVEKENDKGRMDRESKCRDSKLGSKWMHSHLIDLVFLNQIPFLIRTIITRKNGTPKLAYNYYLNQL